MYEAAGYQESRASVKEAFDIILGKTPLRSKANERAHAEYLYGEKGYIAHST
jgi:hypothetical protein